MISGEMRFCLRVIFTAVLLVHGCSGRSVLRRGRDVNTGEQLAGSHEQEDFQSSDAQDGLPSIDLPLDSHPSNSGPDQSERIVDISNDPQENQNDSMSAHLEEIHGIQRTGINDQNQHQIIGDHALGEQSQNLQTRENLEEHHDPDGRVENEQDRLDLNLEGNTGEGDTGEHLETGQNDLEHGPHFHGEQHLSLTGFEHSEHLRGLEQTSLPGLSYSSRDDMDSVTFSGNQRIAEDKITVKPSNNRSQGRRELPDNEIGVSGREIHLLLDASLNNAHVTHAPDGRHVDNDSTQSSGQQHEPFLLEPGVDVDNQGRPSLQNGEHEVVSGRDHENPGGHIPNGVPNNTKIDHGEQPLHYDNNNEAPVVHGVTLGHDGIIPHERHPSENIEPEIVLRNANQSSTAPTVNLNHEQPGIAEHGNHSGEQPGIDIPIEIPKTNHSNELETVEHGHQHELNPVSIQMGTVTSPTTRELATSEGPDNTPTSITQRGMHTEPPGYNKLNVNSTGVIEPGNSGSGTEEFFPNNKTRSNNEMGGSNIENREGSLNRDHEGSENEYTIPEIQCNNSVTTDGDNAVEGTDIDSIENGDAENIIKAETKHSNCKSNLSDQHFSTQSVSEINIAASIDDSTPSTTLEPTRLSEKLIPTSSFVHATPEYDIHEEKQTHMYVSSFPLMTSYERVTGYVTNIQKHSTISTDSLASSQPSFNIDSFQLQTKFLPTESIASTDIVHKSIYSLDPPVTDIFQTTRSETIFDFYQSLGDPDTEMPKTFKSRFTQSSATAPLQSMSESIIIVPSRSADYSHLSTVDTISEESEISHRMSVSTSLYFTNTPSSVPPQSSDTTLASREESLAVVTDAQPSSRPSSNTATLRSTSYVSTTSGIPLTNNRTSLRVMIVDPSTKVKLPDGTTSSPRMTAKKQGIQKPSEKPNMSTRTPAYTTTQPVHIVRQPMALSPHHVTTMDAGLDKTTKGLVLTTPPQLFLQICIRMSTCQFMYQKPNFISELKDLIITEKQVRIEYEQFVVQIKDVPEEYCKDIPSEIALGEETVDQITVDMYIVDKKGNIDIRLTYDASSVIRKGFTDSSSAFKDKIVRVDIQSNQDNQRVTKLSNIKIVETDEEKASIAMVIVLGSVGGCCCVILVILQVVLIHRRVTSKRKASYLSRQLSVRSMDNVALGVIPKSRPNSGYWNPALADVDLYDTKHSHLMNYSELANFCMEITDIYGEFQTIPCEVPDSSVVPIGEEDKNRFANVLPYKHSRVKLKIRRNDKSDYINANYVTGYKDTKRAYIATQSPLVNTVEDFWRMVWEQQSRVILMLNPVLANRKPKQSPCYWPDNFKTDVRRLYGDFSVTLIKRDVQQDYIECTLELMDLELNLKREIRHFWFTCWPESSVLEPLKLVKFVLDTRPQYENSGAPVVIHCGPGQGRTGALIAVDVCMRRFEDKRRVDILNCVYKMRKERSGAVHNKEQYALIYQALNEYAVLLSSPSLSTRSSIITLHAML